MGGCATKPKELERDAPSPVEEETTKDKDQKEEPASDAGNEKDKETVEDGEVGCRQSLGVLLKENEETKEQSEAEKNVEVETATPPAAIEVKEIVEENKTGNQQPDGESTSKEKPEAKITDSETSTTVDKEAMNPESEEPAVKEVVVHPSSEIGDCEEGITEKKEECKAEAAA